MTATGGFQIIDAMLRQNVPLVIIGGHAVIHHGYVRATEDIDIIFQRTPRSEQAIFEVLSQFNAYWLSNEIDPATGIEKPIAVSLAFVRTQHLMMLGCDAGYIDLFDFIPGLESEPIEDLFRSAMVTDNRPFASLAWLRKMKEASGRSQDQLDLKNLPMPPSDH